MIKAIRGTRDLLPPETALWNFVEAACRDVFRDYNFQEIRTPIFESTELFARGVGEDTDIVSKEMYTWYEAGFSFERALLECWLNKHRNAVTSFEFNPRIPNLREGPDAVIWTKDKVYLIEAKYYYDSKVEQQLITYGRAWMSANPDQPRPELLAVVPGGRIPTTIIGAVGGFHVGSEPVDLDELEIPQSLTLRPENTAGVVRAYIEHKMWDRPGLTKLFYIGPQFRRERPQKGRYRQFYQIGAEVIGPPSAGSESPARDAEVLEMLATLLDRVGIQDWTLQLNSVGCANDRPIYLQALREALKPVVGQMCSDCQRRAETNPLRVLDCKVPEDQPIIEKLPKIGDYLDEDCKKHFSEVKAILDSVGIKYVINDRLVRGLDYYTRTAFEFTHGALGAQNAILGGGRYDGLSEAIGGPKAPGIGFAIGEDRLVLSLQQQQETEALVKKPDAYIAPMGAGMNKEAARLARELRRHDLVIELGDETFRLKKSLETASKLGARFAIIVGENEATSGQFALKDLSKGEQVTVPRAELRVRLAAK